MLTQPVAIPGLAGPVVVNMNSFTGKHAVTVGGHSVTSTGRRTYALPAADGRTVEGKVHSSFLDPYPSIEIGGVRHRTGPAVPVGLRVLALLPIVLLIGGLLGGLIGAVAIVSNLAILRTAQSTVVKVVLLAGVFVAAAIVWLVIAAAIQSAAGA